MNNWAASKLSFVLFTALIWSLFFVIHHAWHNTNLINFTNQTEIYERNSKILTDLNKNIDAKSKFLEFEQLKSKKFMRIHEKLLREEKKLQQTLAKLTYTKFQPSMQYEKHRRKLIRNIFDLWEYFKNRVNSSKCRNPLLQKMIEDVYDFKRFLQRDLEQLSRNDGYENWRRLEARKMSEHVQNSFKLLQNPIDCEKEKLLSCGTWEDCGWGCQAHHVVECLSQAMGLHRTLVYDPSRFKYGKGSVEKAFLTFFPKTCQVINSSQYHRIDEASPSERIVIYPQTNIGIELKPRPEFIPSAVPLNLYFRLEKLAELPIVWWMGEIYKFAFKFTNLANKLVEKKIESMQLKHPIVGIQVRRTDKLLYEADGFSLNDYMRYVKEYYDVLELSTVIDKRRVMIATDDVAVIQEAKINFSNYEIIANAEAAKNAFDPNSRNTFESLMDAVVDIEILSKCDYVVCTFSSNMCRLVHEIMVARDPTSFMKVHSLDLMYSNYGENLPEGVVVSENRETRSMNLQKGSKVIIQPYFNGYGQYYIANPVGNKTGYVAKFFLEQLPELVQFPKDLL